MHHILCIQKKMGSIMTWAQRNSDCGWVHAAFTLSFVSLMTFGCASDDRDDGFVRDVKRDPQMGYGSIATGRIVDTQDSHHIIDSFADPCRVEEIYY